MQIIKAEEIAQYAGHKAEPSAWHHVTQAQIDQFADCTKDQQFIHVDPEAAAKGPFGTTIAHGFLTLSMLSHLCEASMMAIEGVHTFINSGFDKIRFLAPVKVDSRIRAHCTVLSIEERKPGQFRISTEVSVEIEGEETPALVAEWISVQLCK